MNEYQPNPNGIYWYIDRNCNVKEINVMNQEYNKTDSIDEALYVSEADAIDVAGRYRAERMKEMLIQLPKAFVVFALALACVVMVLHDPIDNSQSELTLVLIKIAGFACGYAAYKLAKLWKQNKYISKLL